MPLLGSPIATVPLDAFVPELRTEATFLDVAYEMPGEWVATGPTNRAFGAGIEFVPWGTGSGTLVQLSICGPAEAEVVPHGLTSVKSQYPFRLADALYCTSLSVSKEELAALAVARLRLLESAAFAQQLVRPTTVTADGLASTATIPFTTTATHISRAIARLEIFLATKLVNGIGFIHLDPGSFSLAVAAESVILRNGMWVTASGHRVIADAGYVNAAAPTGQAQQQPESRWIYASGPVFYSIKRAGPVEGMDSAGAAYDFPHNEHESYADVYGLVAFDTNTVGAVRVDLTV